MNKYEKQNRKIRILAQKYELTGNMFDLLKLHLAIKTIFAIEKFPFIKATRELNEKNKTK